MRVVHRDRRLERMDRERRGDGSFELAVVRAFLKCMDLIRAAPNTQALRAFKSRRLEKLKGNRSHQHSMRLNNQWRLILEIEDGDEPTATIVEIDDYH